MKFKDAQELLDPYHIIILHYKTLKMYSIFLNYTTLQISEEDFKYADEVELKTVIAQALVKEATSNVRMVLH